MIPPRKSRVLRQLRAGRRALSYHYFGKLERQQIRDYWPAAPGRIFIAVDSVNNDTASGNYRRQNSVGAHCTATYNAIHLRHGNNAASALFVDNHVGTIGRGDLATGAVATPDSFKYGGHMAALASNINYVYDKKAAQ